MPSLPQAAAKIREQLGAGMLSREAAVCYVNEKRAIHLDQGPIPNAPSWMAEGGDDWGGRLRKIVGSRAMGRAGDRSGEPQTRISAIVLAVMLLGAATAPAWAFDAEEVFKKGTFVLSGEGSYGGQVNDEHLRGVTFLEFYDLGARFSLLPFEPLGRDHFWYGALEVGLEPLYQHYTTPKQAFWAGLSAVVRYHFLALGRVVPYVEIAGSAGSTDLKVPEIRSAFAFLLFGGVGASVFVSDTIALYLGYRFQHVSNGDTSKPNRGFESNAVVGGVSFYFP